MRYVNIILLLILIVACPKPDEKLDPAVCDEGYYPCGPDSQECCLDTSSHNFEWEIHEVGEYWSYFSDIAVIQDDDIWLVGEIVSDGEDYNVAHWDGDSFSLVQVEPQGYHQAISSIHYFADNDIWLSASTLPVHWDGITYKLFTPAIDGYPGGSVIRDIWGRNPSEIYIAGNGGMIVHFDGISFITLNSGTSIDLQEVHASDDGEYIFFQGVHSSGYGSTLIQYHSGETTVLYECTTLLPGDDDYGYLDACFVTGDLVISSTKAGVWRYNIRDQTSELTPNEITQSANIAIQKVLGNTANDYIMCGNLFKFIHYNGASFNHNYQLASYLNDNDSRLFGGVMDGDRAFVCGAIHGYNFAALAIGRRE